MQLCTSPVTLAAKQDHNAPSPQKERFAQQI